MVANLGVGLVAPRAVRTTFFASAVIRYRLSAGYVGIIAQPFTMWDAVISGYLNFANRLEVLYSAFSKDDAAETI